MKIIDRIVHQITIKKLIRCHPHSPRSHIKTNKIPVLKGLLCCVHNENTPQEIVIYFESAMRIPFPIVGSIGCDVKIRWQHGIV